MDSTKTIDESPAEGTPSEGKADQAHKTPVRPGKGVKRKHQTPTPGKLADEEKPGSAKKRRKSASSTPLSRVASPGTTPFKPAMTERQQMALLLQMTDPNKQHASGDETPPIGVIDSTPRSRVTKKNERGETPLHIACIKGDLKTATSLINQGAEVNEADNAGWTPLHEACNYGHNRLVSLLVKHGANVNARGMDGDSPLHDAVGNGHLEVVKTLLEHGSDPHQANDKGLTPADTCKDQGILSFLKENTKEVEEQAEEEEGEGENKMADGGTSLGGEEEMEEGDEDVFETKRETDLPDTGKRGKGKPAILREGERESQMSEEGPLPSKTPSSVRKQLKDNFSTNAPPLRNPQPSDVVKNAGDVNGASDSNTSLTKLIGKATPFFSDISSSESESELPEVKRTRLTEKRESASSMPSREDEGVGEGEEKGRSGQRDSLEEESGEKEDESEASPSTKEEAKVKMHVATEVQQGGVAEKESSPIAASEVKSPEGISKTLQDQNKTDEDKLAAKRLVKGDPTSPGADYSTTTTKDAESADIKTAQSAEDTTPADGQFKGHPSPLASPPHVVKSSEPLPTQAELDEAMAMREREDFVVSIPLFLVKVSRRAKSRSSSKDFGESHSGTGDVKMDLSDLGEEGVAHSREKQLGSGKETHTNLPSVLLTRSDSRTDLLEHLRSSRRSVERRDSTSSQESRSSTSGERKHSRKPQHVYSSKMLFKESKKEDERKRDDGADSFSISVEFGVLPSQPSKLIRQSSLSSPTSLTVASSTPGLSVQSQGKITVEDSASVLLRPQSANASRDGCEAVNNDSSGGEDSKSTVVSFSTSLPIHFCSQSSVVTSSSLQSRSAAHSRDVLATPPAPFRSKTTPMLIESVKASASAPVTPLKRERSSGTPARQGQEPGAQSEQDVLSLPPKKRFRAVQRSSVIQQRRMRPDVPVTTPPHFPSFLMCSGQYRSKHHVQPTNPKTVYPPLHAAMYRLFNEQESERVRLATAHLAEQDRILLSMEQELLRAYQRASKCPSPLSVCSVLLEELLPKSVYGVAGDAPCQGSGAGESGVQAVDCKLMSPTVKSNGLSNGPVDVRLLSGLVQDVWDKFFQLKESMDLRQRHEAEALWLVQQELWRQYQNEMGFHDSNFLHNNVPPAHVPLAN